jgi:hypothetical protein
MGLGSDMSPSVMVASSSVVILTLYSGRGEVGGCMFGRESSLHVVMKRLAETQAPVGDAAEA